METVRDDIVAACHVAFDILSAEDAGKDADSEELGHLVADIFWKLAPHLPDTDKNLRRIKRDLLAYFDQGDDNEFLRRVARTSKRLDSCPQ